MVLEGAHLLNNVLQNSLNASELSGFSVYGEVKGWMLRCPAVAVVVVVVVAI